MAHVAQRVHQQTERGEGQQRAQLRLVAEEEGGNGQHDVTERGQERLESQRGGQVAVGVLGTVGYVADDDQPMPKSGMAAPTAISAPIVP